MILLGIDPGKSAGYAWGDDCKLRGAPQDCRVPLPPRPHVLAVSSAPRGDSVARCIVEAQYPNPAASRQGLITLAFGAGYRLGGVQAEETFAAPPTGRLSWKAILWPGRLTKAQFCNRVLSNLHENERALLPRNGREDALDAIGLMWALDLAPPAILKKWRYPKW